MLAIKLSFLFVFLYIVIALLRTKHAVSFRGFFFMFALFFYSIAPFIQFLNYTPWPIAKNETFLEVNYILLFSFIVYDFVYGFSFEKNDSPDVTPLKKQEIVLSSKGAIYLLILALFWGFFTFYTQSFSLKNLLFRGGMPTYFGWKRSNQSL